MSFWKLTAYVKSSINCTAGYVVVKSETSVVVKSETINSLSHVNLSDNYIWDGLIYYFNKINLKPIKKEE